MTRPAGEGQTSLSAVAGRRRGGGEQSMVPPGEPRSYYGQPILAAPVWEPYIAGYFFAGGLGGAALPLSLAASLRGEDALARRASLLALAGAVVSPVLLIADLGRPERFLYMLRVFKVTSPMSVGSWVLTGYGAASALGAARETLGILPAAGRAGQAAGVVLGPMMTTYTAALVAGTSVPVWHDARRELPFLFAASSVASAGAAATALSPPDEAAAARRMAVAGAVAEAAVSQLMERRLGFVGEPYKQGRIGWASRGATAASLSGAAALAASGRSRRASVAASLLILLGALLQRIAVFFAGTASASDPRYTVKPQRDRLRETGGRPSRHVRGTQDGAVRGSAANRGPADVIEPDPPRA